VHAGDIPGWGPTTPEEIAHRRAARRREERERRARRRRKRTLQAGAVGGALVVLLIVTGGGGGHRHFERRARDFTWAADFGGSPPSIADENRAAGTGAWRLPGGRARGSVVGYPAAESVRPGEVQRLYVRALGARWVRVDVYRMGWYGGRGGRLVLASRRLPARPQPPCPRSHRTGLVECRWHPTLSFRVPSGLPSGVYVAKLESDAGAQRYAVFVVESARSRPLLAQLATATYQAYNAWGGDSLYPGGRPVAVTGTSQGVEVSYDRPYQTITGAGRFFAGDVAMMRFIEREGYDASYTTDSSVDARPGQVLGHRLVLDIGHSEYWSQRAADALRRARDAGTNLAFLASNTMAWRVRYARPHRIVAYKEHAALDPDRRLPSGLFPLGGAPTTGTSWQRCVTPRYPARGHAVYHYYAWRPGLSLQPAWLFAGTGFVAGSQVNGIVGYELDRTSIASPLGTQVVGGGSTPCLGGRPPIGVSQSTLYQAPSGALVFSSGTMGWELGLSPVPAASPDAPRRPDPRLVRLTENLFARMLSRGG
jgi:N,N-dimethylformamidase beta subunit-like protein